MYRLVCSFTDGSKRESLHATQIAAIRRANSVIGKLRTGSRFPSPKKTYRTVSLAEVVDTQGKDPTYSRRGQRGDEWLPMKEATCRIVQRIST